MREQLIELLEKFARDVTCFPGINKNPEAYKDFVEDNVDEIMEITDNG